MAHHRVNHITTLHVLELRNRYLYRSNVWVHWLHVHIYRCSEANDRISLNQPCTFIVSWLLRREPLYGAALGRISSLWRIIKQLFQLYLCTTANWVLRHHKNYDKINISYSFVIHQLSCSAMNSGKPNCYFNRIIGYNNTIKLFGIHPSAFRPKPASSPTSHNAVRFLRLIHTALTLEPIQCQS